MTIEPMLESTAAFFSSGSRFHLHNSFYAIREIHFLWPVLCVFAFAWQFFFSQCCCCCYCCCCYARQQIQGIKLSAFFVAFQWIFIQRWSVYSLPFVRCARCFRYPMLYIFFSFCSLHFWMNISKIYTLTNNDWMNSNVKTPHCSHHSSYRQKTIQKD